MRAKGREQMHKLQNPQSKHEMQTDLRKMQAKNYAEAATTTTTTSSQPTENGMQKLQQQRVLHKAQRDEEASLRCRLM